MVFMILLLIVAGCYGQYRNRPRGLGLLRLPAGVTDERSSLFFPGLYIGGNKASSKPQSVPDIHLPGQTGIFTGKTSFNPFTNAVSAVYIEDLNDSWGTGYAVQGVNNYNLKVRQNFDEFADMPVGHDPSRASARYQPFINSFVVGAEYDLNKFREVAGKADIPILGVNEIFDLDGDLLTKGSSTFNSYIDFPLTLTDPYERFPTALKYFNYMADRHMAYGHVVPNVNLFLIEKDKIIQRLSRNRLNPTFVG